MEFLSVFANSVVSFLGRNTVQSIARVTLLYICSVLCHDNIT